jgi:hypothetical protein
VRKATATGAGAVVAVIVEKHFLLQVKSLSWISVVIVSIDFDNSD